MSGPFPGALSLISQVAPVAFMDCAVNGPCEADGADVAIFAGKGRGVICVQGERKRTVAEADMLDALYEEVVAFAARVQRGEAR